MMQKSLIFGLVVLAILSLNADAKSMKKGKGKGSKGGKNQFIANGPFFSIPLVVGSGKTKLNVGIDGMYGASLVYGKGVACDGSDYYCVQHDTFDHSASSSFHPHTDPRDFTFTLGTASGLSGGDDISVGSLKLSNAMFGVARSIPRYLNRKTKNSGHLAMNAPVDADDDKTTMQKIIEQAPKPTITFYAPADQNGKHAITIGSEDTTHCKTNWIKFQNQPAVDPSNNLPWTINFQGFKWGSQDVTEKMNVALNPASDFFVAPKRHANYLYEKLGAKYSYDYSGGLVDCSKRSSAPSLEFKVAGGKTLIVTPQQYIKQFGSGTCLLNIYPDELNLWTLPYQFFQKYCVKFDYGMKEVSVADQM